MKVELSLHASKLRNVAGAFKGTSDPYAVVTLLPSSAGDKPTVLGKTEVVKNSLSPRWVKVVQLDYELGEPKRIAVNIFDEVRKGENKPMGSAVFDIGELLGSRGNTKAKKIKKGGTLFATVRKSEGTGLLRLQLKGNALKNMEGMFRKSDPFFELSRKVSSAGGLTWDNVYRSKVQNNNLNPEWEAAAIELSVLCGGDLDLPILLHVFDHEKSGKHVSMGKFETTVNVLVNAAATKETLTLEEKGKNVGTLVVVKAEVSGVVDSTEGISAGVAAMSIPVAAAQVEPIPVPVPVPVGKGQGANFVDYVSGGCELNVVVAIDFTGSNGDPRKPGTLHYMNPDGSTNDYEKAICAIVGILEDYDYDKMFPVYGFGAKYGGIIRHCFQCGPQPEVHGAQGVMEAYRQVFRSGLVMSGPTVFTEVMETAAAKAMSSLDAAEQNGRQAYTILLILTDGAVSDVQATASLLETIGSDAPLSVVIVGIGNADFSAMQFLDDANQQPGKRDIAQFVQFNKHRQNCTALTSETLHEIPEQLVGFFQSRGIAPLPPLERRDSEIAVEPEDEEIDLSLNINDDEIVVESYGDDFVSGFASTR